MEKKELIPKSWIEQRVSLRYRSGRGDTPSMYCTLKDVNDQGAVVEEPEEVTAFYPWSSVVSIKVGESERQHKKMVDAF